MPKKLMNGIVSFVKEENGETVNWLVVILISIVLAIAIYLGLKNAPGGIGEGIESAGETAKEGLESIQY